MSQENVAVVRGAFEALSRADIPAFLQHFDSDVEWWDRRDALHPEVFRGHDGIRRITAGVVELFTDWRTEATDLIAAGEYVVVPVHHVGRGRSSNIPVDARETYACRMRDGKIIELREYKETAEALEAVGLEE